MDNFTVLGTGRQAQRYLLLGRQFKDTEIDPLVAGPKEQPVFCVQNTE